MPSRKIRPMKPLFTLLISVWVTAVYADQYVSAPVRYSEMPMSETATVYDVPSYTISNSIVTIVPTETSPHTVAKPTDKPIAVPSRLGPLMPMQEALPVETEETKVVRGQVAVGNELEEILSTAPPIARGAVEEGTIDPKLVESSDSSSVGFDDILAANWGQSSSSQSGSVDQAGAKQTDPLGYGMLLVTTIVMTIGLVVMAFVAYDYHQRWVQALTVQNDRYLGGGSYDMEMEDTFSGSVSFSDFGLPRRSSV